MPNQSRTSRRQSSAPKHRVGRVTVYRRGQVWYVYYLDRGKRIRQRIGPALDEARNVAAEINAQLARGARAGLSYKPLSIPELRDRWLNHHEQVLRSSIATVRRYRAATEHLLRFVETERAHRVADRITATDAERFVCHLRTTRVAPNGHPNAARRHLRDKGIVFILQSCRAMFNYAARCRHLPPYHENPFSQIDIDRIPIENAKPTEPFSPEQEAAFLKACDDWQFPIFLTMGLTGMRSGEARHLLVPEDVDLSERVIRVRNKPDLGWRTKTRNERGVPIGAELCEVLHHVIGGRTAGPLFMRRRFVMGDERPLLAGLERSRLAAELVTRIRSASEAVDGPWTRFDDARVARGVWRDSGAIRASTIRVAFMAVTAKIGLAHVTGPKILRHLFATCLQDANVDPLIRQELMGHARGPRHRDGLGMTTIYTHTRASTLRAQFEAAMAKREVANQAARQWICSR